MAALGLEQDGYLTQNDKVRILHNDLDRLIAKIREVDPDGKNGFLDLLGQYFLVKIEDPNEGLPVLQ